MMQTFILVFMTNEGSVGTSRYAQRIIIQDHSETNKRLAKAFEREGAWRRILHWL